MKLDDREALIQGAYIGFVRPFLAMNTWIFDTRKEQEVFVYLCERSVRFGSYEVTLTAKQFGAYVPKIPLQIITGPAQSIRKARADLIKKNAISVDWPTGTGYVGMYRVNFPGILKIALRPVWPEVKEVPRFQAWASLIRETLNFDDIKLSEAAMSKIEEMVQAGKDVHASRKSAKKGRKKTPEGIQWNPAHARDWIKLTCESYGVTYGEPSWTGKERGAFKQFLKYCFQDDADPKVILEGAIRRWSQLRDRILTGKDGKKLLLGTTFSFWEFYAYRRQIMAYLSTGSHVSGAERPRTKRKWVTPEEMAGGGK